MRIPPGRKRVTDSSATGEKGFNRRWSFSYMNRQYSGFAGSSFSLCYILRLFMKGNEGCIVEFTVLRTGKTTGPPADNMLFSVQ